MGRGYNSGDAGLAWLRAIRFARTLRPSATGGASAPRRRRWIAAAAVVSAAIGLVSSIAGLTPFFVPSLPSVASIELSACDGRGPSDAFLGHILAHPRERKLYAVEWFQIDARNNGPCEDDAGKTRPSAGRATVSRDLLHARFQPTLDGEHLYDVVFEIPEEALDSVILDCDCDPGEWVGAAGVAQVWLNDHDLEDYPTIHIKMVALDPEIAVALECTKKKDLVGPIASWFVCLPGGERLARLLPGQLLAWRCHETFPDPQEPGGYCRLQNLPEFELLRKRPPAAL